MRNRYTSDLCAIRRACCRQPAATSSAAHELSTHAMESCFHYYFASSMWRERNSRMIRFSLQAIIAMCLVPGYRHTYIFTTDISLSRSFVRTLCIRGVRKTVKLHESRHLIMGHGYSTGVPRHLADTSSSSCSTYQWSSWKTFSYICVNLYSIWLA